MKKLTVDDLVADLKTQNQSKKDTADRLDGLAVTARGSDAVQLAIIQTTGILLDYFRNEIQSTTVTNFPDPVTSVETPDFKEIVSAVNELKNVTDNKNVDFQPVVDVLNEVKVVADSLPKEYPKPIEPPKSVEINNLDELLEEVKSVAQKIEAQKLDPTIKVSPTKVNIDLKPLEEKIQKLIDKKTPDLKFPKIPATDLGPLTEATDKVRQAIEAQKFPVPNFTSSFKDSNGPTSVTLQNGLIPVSATISTTNYTTRIEEDSGDANITYIGNAVIGSAEASAVWQIKRLDATTGLVKLWRDGNDSYDNAWSTREAGSYS